MLLDAWGQGCTYRRVAPMLDALRDARVKQVEVAEALGMTKQAVGAWYKGKQLRAIKISAHAEEALIQGFAESVGKRYRRPSLQQQHAFGVRWAMWRAATEVMDFDDEGPPSGPTLSAFVYVWSTEPWYRAFVDGDPNARQIVIEGLWAYMQPRWGSRLIEVYGVADAATCYEWFKNGLMDWFEPYLLTTTYLLRALCPNEPPDEDSGEDRHA